MIGNETDEIIEKLFDSLLQKHQEKLEKSMKGKKFIFDTVDLFDCKFHKISLNCGRSYIDSPEWLKTKKAGLNLKNNNDKCFQYAITIALNYEQIKRHSERISKIKPFINQYNWKEIDFLPDKIEWKKFESNNKSFVLNILYVPYNTENMEHAYGTWNMEQNIT